MKTVGTETYKHAKKFNKEIKVFVCEWLSVCLCMSEREERESDCKM